MAFNMGTPKLKGLFQFLIGRVGRITKAKGRQKTRKFQFLIGRVGRLGIDIGALLEKGFQFLIGRVGRRLF